MWKYKCRKKESIIGLFHGCLINGSVVDGTKDYNRLDHNNNIVKRLKDR